MRNVQSTLLFKWFNEVWNNGDENAIDQLLAFDAKANGILTEDQPKGSEGFKLFFNDFRRQFHDIKIDIEDVVSEDDIESARTNVSAIHTESGKAVTFSGICMARIENGKIAEAWNNYDFLNLYQQLGQKLVATAESEA